MRHLERTWLFPAALACSALAAQAAPTDAPTDAAPGAPRRLTVEAAEAAALASNARFAAQRARAQADHHQADSVSARLFPSIHVADEYQHYDSPFEISFALPGAATEVMAPAFTARGEDTNSFVVSAHQPLLGLLHLVPESRARARAAEATDARVEASKAQLKEAIRVGFLRYFEAKALEDVAHSSVVELAEQVRQIEAQIRAGVATDVERMRASVAVSRARQQEIVAHAQAEVGKARLLAVVGIDAAETPVELEEPRALFEAGQQALPTLAEARAQALEQRAELTAADLERRSADDEASARFFALLPEIDAEAAYVRVDGQAFAPPNSAFIGLKAAWPLFEWGAGWHAHGAADARARAAALELDGLKAQVAVEVTAALLEAEAARSAVEVAEQAIASAQAAFHQTNAELSAGAATSKDVLDAESSLTQAKLNLAQVRYAAAIARISLARAVGTLD